MIKDLERVGLHTILYLKYIMIMTKLIDYYNRGEGIQQTRVRKSARRKYNHHVKAYYMLKANRLLHEVKIENKEGKVVINKFPKPQPQVYIRSPK